MANIDIMENASDADVASFIETALRQALAASDLPVEISVPGGSTPFPIMRELVKADLDWSRVTVWPGDDRVVPEDHEASNTGKIRALFEPVGAHVATLTVMEQVPHFALVWLGMGADGHVASLFPNTDPQAGGDRSGDETVGRGDDHHLVAGIQVLTDQRLALTQHDGFDVVAHELLVPRLQLRHSAAAKQFLAEILVRMHVEIAGEVVLVEGIVARTVVAGVDDAALTEVFAPGVVAVTGQESVIKIEKSQAHAAFLGG